MSTKRMTKAQRVQQKIEAGRSHIDAEVAVAQELHREEMAALKAKAQREQRKVEALIPGIIQEQHPEVYDQAEAEARRRHEKARAKRASARRGTSAKSAESVSVHEPHDDTQDSWSDAR